MEWIFHIAERAAWERGVGAGRYVAPSLASEGFIHCSNRDQVIETANRYYRGRSGFLLLCIDAQQLGSALKYEPPILPAGISSRAPDRQGLFPHVYGPIDVAAVVRVLDFEPNATGQFTWPPSAP